MINRKTISIVTLSVRFLRSFACFNKADSIFPTLKLTVLCARTTRQLAGWSFQKTTGTVVYIVRITRSCYTQSELLHWTAVNLTTIQLETTPGVSLYNKFQTLWSSLTLTQKIWRRQQATLICELFKFLTWVIIISYFWWSRSKRSTWSPNSKQFRFPSTWSKTRSIISF